ncbi:hypothetical protein GCQ56_07750 [Marinifilum sp. N1E240]|uniref:hypothetical protein n=1 Tax=Marinifilum sp. N1E240 TaxID=2608082 RepID=UPI00128C6EC2|nr:hypothetical protein [Marinifilum sp. N1E240]MPQ46907.1 hypothetical protein [Marinifilum sp. N1E240]
MPSVKNYTLKTYFRSENTNPNTSFSSPYTSSSETTSDSSNTSDYKYAKIEFENIFSQKNVFQKDVIFNGNIIQNSSHYVTKAEQLEVKNNILWLNKNEPSNTITSTIPNTNIKFSGLNLGRGTGSDYWFGVVEGSKPLIKLGKINSLETVATREDAISDGYSLAWDASNKRIVGVASVKDSLKLGGYDASKYARTNINETFNGQVTFNNGNYNPLRLDRTGTSNVNMSFYHNGTLKGYFGIGSNNVLTWGLSADSRQNNTIWHSGNSNKSTVNWNARALLLPRLEMSNTGSYSTQLKGLVNGGDISFKTRVGDVIYTQIVLSGNTKAPILYHSGLRRFETTSSGTLTTGNHTATGTVISTSTLGFKINSEAGYIAGYDSSGSVRNGFLQFKATANSILSSDNGQIEIRGVGIKRFETTSSGTSTTGTAVITSGFDSKGGEHKLRAAGTGNNVLRFINDSTEKATIYSSGSQFRLRNLIGEVVMLAYNSEIFRLTNDGTKTTGNQTVTGSGSYGGSITSTTGGLSANLSGNDLIFNRNSTSYIKNNGGSSASVAVSINDAAKFLVNSSGTYTTGVHKIVKASENLILKGTSSGVAATPYMRFQTSTGTGLGYIGYGSNVNNTMYINNQQLNGNIDLRAGDTGSTTNRIGAFIGGVEKFKVHNTGTTTTGMHVTTGDLQTYGRHLNRNDIVIVNKAANNWLTFAERDTTGSEAVYNLQNVGDFRAKGYVGSDSYVSGFGGSGWRTDVSGNMTVDSLTVRKSMNVYELNINKIRSGNGSYWFSDGMKYEVDNGSNSTYYRIGVDTDNGKNIQPFAVGDIVRCQVWNGRGIKYYTLVVDAQSSNESHSYFRAPVSSKTGSGVPEIGDELVRIGNVSDTNRQGAVYITSNDNNSPYVDVLDGVNSDSFAGKTKVRLGKLDGITSPTWNNLSGYGFWTENGYLEGGINAKFGKIGGWNISDSTLQGGSVVLKSDGTIYNFKSSYLWRLNGDGSGILASGAISWDKLGNVTFTDKVKLSWNQVTDTSGLTNSISTAQNTAETGVTNAATAQSKANSAYTLAGSKITSSQATTITKDTVSSTYINGLACSFNQGKIASFNIKNSSLSSSVDSKHLVLQNSETDTVHGGAKRGLTLYVDNTKLINSDSIKIIQLGMLCNKDSASSFPSTPNYGFRIVKGNNPYKDIFRADNAGAFIAGWNFNEDRFSGGNVVIRSTGEISNTTKWGLYNDGSGFLANNNISWNSSGNVTFSSAVKLNWQNDPLTANNVNSGGVVTVKRPIGGELSLTGTNTGAIKVTLPQSWTNTMMEFHVDVYNYSSNKAFTLRVSGYNYSTGWVNTSVALTGSKEADNRVRFGHDGTKCCIYIGESNSNWYYPKIVVRDFKSGHSGSSISKWSTGWDIGITTSIASNIDKDYSNALIDSGDTLSVNSAKVGGVTLITNNKIRTSLLEADVIKSSIVQTTDLSASKMTTGTLSAARISTGSLHGNKITSNTITATQIAANAITTSELAANSVYAENIKSGVIDATKINTSSIQAAVVTASKINTLSLASTKGTIGAWIINTASIYSGTYQGSNAYTTSGMTIHKDGAIRAKYFRVDTDGKMFAKSGEIGGFKIGSSSLISTNLSLQLNASGGDIGVYRNSSQQSAALYVGYNSGSTLSRTGGIRSKTYSSSSDLGVEIFANRSIYLEGDDYTFLNSPKTLTKYASEFKLGGCVTGGGKVISSTSSEWSSNSSSPTQLKMEFNSYYVDFDASGSFYVRLPDSGNTPNGTIIRIGTSGKAVKIVANSNSRMRWDTNTKRTSGTYTVSDENEWVEFIQMSDCWTRLNNGNF